jgi:hypothetical protein
MLVPSSGRSAASAAERTPGRAAARAWRSPREQRSGRVGVLRQREVEHHDVDVRRVEAGIDRRRAPERAQEQPAGEDEQQRQGDLRDEEHAAQTQPSARGAVGAGLQRRDDVWPRGLQRGGEPGYERRGQ